MTGCRSGSADAFTRLHVERALIFHPM